MKKKIKDLTLEEIIEISLKGKNKGCPNCSLFDIDFHCYEWCCASKKKINKILNQEIEV